MLRGIYFIVSVDFQRYVIIVTIYIHSQSLALHYITLHLSWLIIIVAAYTYLCTNHTILFMGYIHAECDVSGAEKAT